MTTWRRPAPDGLGTTAAGPVSEPSCRRRVSRWSNRAAGGDGNVLRPESEKDFPKWAIAVNLKRIRLAGGRCSRHAKARNRLVTDAWLKRLNSERTSRHRLR